MLLDELLLKKKIFLIAILSIFATLLFSQVRNWQQLFQDINRPVYEIKQTHHAVFFALPGSGGGLGYLFDTQDSLNIYSIDTNIGAVSIEPDIDNDRVFCAFGTGSNSDGLYKFDLNTQEFQIIGWYFFPHFVKKLSSGFYFGYGDNNTEGGLLYSANGDNWTMVDFFNNKNVIDVEEDNFGRLLVATDDKIYFENEVTYDQLTAPSQIRDIYIRNQNEIYIACGIGSSNDAIYRVEYNGSGVGNFIPICQLYKPNKIYIYENYLVVGCSENLSNLFLVEPTENGEVIEIGQEIGINGAYYFDSEFLDCPNFIVGTNIGIFLATNLLSSFEDKINNSNISTLKNNYPNPFNPQTTINYALKEDAEVKIDIYNLKGEKIKTLVNDNKTAGYHSVIWNGDTQYGKPVTSGIYLYRLIVNKRILDMKKCMLLK